MAEHRISGRKLAEAMHMDQRAFSRRYAGKVPWSFDEMVTIAGLLRTSVVDLCAIRDSNPEPADLVERASDLRLILGASDDLPGF